MKSESWYNESDKVLITTALAQRRPGQLAFIHVLNPQVALNGHPLPLLLLARREREKLLRKEALEQDAPVRIRPQFAASQVKRDVTFLHSLLKGESMNL